MEKIREKRNTSTTGITEVREGIPPINGKNSFDYQTTVKIMDILANTEAENAPSAIAPKEP